MPSLDMYHLPSCVNEIKKEHLIYRGEMYSLTPYDDEVHSSQNGSVSFLRA